MGFTEQGEGLLQDRPAGTGTRKLSGVATSPPTPVWKGLLSSFHTWKGFPGQKAVVRKGSRGLWNERASSSGSTQGGRTQPHQRGGVCDRPSTPVN